MLIIPCIAIKRSLDIIKYSTEEMTVEGNRKGVGLRERTEDRETRRDEKIRK